MTMNNQMADIVVIGGGPAGLTAAMYAVQKKLNVLLISRDMGGKTNYHLQLPFIERHMVINGDEIVNRFSRELEYLDYVYRHESVDTIEKTDDGFHINLHGGGGYDTRTVIVASGARGQKLDVPGEQEFMMRGLCYSATSYAQLFMDKSVAVVGDGDLMLRSAAELATYASKLTVIALEDHVLNTPMAERLSRIPGVEFLSGYKVQRVEGDMYARTVVVSNGTTRRIDVDGVFVEVALEPRTRFLVNLCELDPHGRVKVNTRCETSQPGIFAAGDCTDVHAEQVLVAVGEGAKAALSAYDYLIDNGLL